MAKVRIEFNDEGFRKLRFLPAGAADGLRRGQAIADAAGEGVDAQLVQGRDRWRVIVQTNTDEAMRAEAEDKTLTAAVGAGRG
mgnify:CR=1 FL=1